ncbi:MAG: lycopene beta-cyclase CrtY [Bdellovibrio sp.]
MPDLKQSPPDEAKTRPQHFDAIVVGAGLSGSLLSLGLLHHFPRLRILVLEKAPQLGIQHTWSFHDSDIPESLRSWIRNLISKSWSTHEVFFPALHRVLASPYHSIRQEDLSLRLSQSGAQVQTSCSVMALGSDFALDDRGQIYRAPLVVDARGWSEFPGPCGYQKFVGLDVELQEPHGMQHVRLMDARIPQIDGYRFMYVLPWSEKHLLIEDTYYSNHALLKIERIEQEILRYAEGQGWRIASIQRREVGCLPLPLFSTSYPSPAPSPQSLGARGQRINAVTGYTTPLRLRFLDLFFKTSSPSQENFERTQARFQKEEQQQENFYLMLNRMMFQAAANDERYRILQKFYRLPEGVVQRFYSGRLSWLDKARILSGRPPVSVAKALRAIIAPPASVLGSQSLPRPGDSPRAPFS